MLLGNLTWEEVGAYLRKQSSLIIPIGICEQHSKHLPLNSDILIAEYIANYLSEKTKILIAPTFNYGIGLPCDRFYPGSSSLQYKDLKGSISSLISWWKLQGFKNFFLVTAHGDPFHLKALREVEYDRIFILEVYDINLEDILEKQKNAKHAGEAETSVMLYLFPEKVRKKRIENFETPWERFKDYLKHSKNDSIPNSPGCQGYPIFATKEKGKKIVEIMKEHALMWIQKCLQE